jgi:hypothetical protein
MATALHFYPTPIFRNTCEDTRQPHETSRSTHHLDSGIQPRVQETLAPVRHPRLFLGHLFVFYSALITHHSLLPGAVSRYPFSKTTPHRSNQPFLLRRFPAFIFYSALASRLFPAIAAATPSLAAIRRNSRENQLLFSRISRLAKELFLFWKLHFLFQSLLSCSRPLCRSSIVQIKTGVWQG